MKQCSGLRMYAFKGVNRSVYKIQSESVSQSFMITTAEGQTHDEEGWDTTY